MLPVFAVNSAVSINDGCPISYHVNCRAEADFSCGSPNGVLELTFQADALREFLRLGAEALREVEERFAREAADRARAG
jgi:hypothetical protein